MNRISKGIFPALVTPFDKDGQVNTNVLQKLVDKLKTKGVSGFYVGGSTGESYLLSMDERKKILEAVVEVCDSQFDVIANIGMMATDQSIELAKHAEKLNVKAISSVPPFYFSFNMDEYYTYYNDIAEAVDVPVIIYNIPAMSGVQFSMEDLERLLSNNRVIGIKHTSYDLFQLQRLIKNHPDKTVFTGHDELFLSALAIGARAGIGSTYNIMSEKFQNMIECYNQNQKEEALAIQSEVNEIVEVLCKVGVFKGIKEILLLQGYDCGVARKPFLPLSNSEKKVVREIADKYKLI